MFGPSGPALESPKLEYVRDCFGPASERELRQLLEGHPGVLPVLDSAMYPFEVYDEVNRAIAERHFGGDLSKLQEVGVYSARKVLTTVYKAFAVGKDYPGFLRRAAVLHERFYSQGRMIVELGRGGSSATIHLAEAPVYSEADLQIAAGFYRGAAELMGMTDLGCTFELRDDGAHFQLDWS